MLMSYVPYVTKEYYFDTYGGTIVPEELLERYIRQASRHIGFPDFQPYCKSGNYKYDTISAGYHPGSGMYAG